MNLAFQYYENIQPAKNWPKQKGGFMAKGKNVQKTDKKKSEKSLKEKRKEKKEKKTQKDRS